MSGQALRGGVFMWQIEIKVIIGWLQLVRATGPSQKIFTGYYVLVNILKDY